MSQTTIRLSGLVLLCLAGALACEKPSPPPPAATPAPVTPPPAAAATETPVATAPPVKLDTVPAREDFEEEAEAQITPANLEKQLEALEKELAAE